MFTYRLHKIIKGDNRTMKIQFIGATHEVTGSCTLLEVNNKYYLVDCGMEQGKDVFQNITLPIPATEIEAVFFLIIDQYADLSRKYIVLMPEFELRAPLAIPTVSARITT